MSPRSLFSVSALGLIVSACFQTHSAPVRTSALPPAPDPVVRHASRLWIALDAAVGSDQCVIPRGSRQLCFEEVDTALGSALGRTLWTSFPGISLLSREDTPAPGDYVLKLELRLDAVPPAAGGPGWAAAATGRWQLERDGVALGRERVKSVSRAEFGYGGPLGYAAGEVVDAIAVHIGTVLGAVPEKHPPLPRPLPPVTAEVVPLDSTSRMAVQQPAEARQDVP